MNDTLKCQADEAIKKIKAGDTDRYLHNWLMEANAKGVTAAELGYPDEDISELLHRFNKHAAFEAIAMIGAKDPRGEHFGQQLMTANKEGVTAKELHLSEDGLRALLARAH